MISGLYKNNLTNGFCVRSVMIVNIPRIAGSADSLMANMKTVAPGNNPIPPVKRALIAPRMEKKFHFRRRIKSRIPYDTGKEMAKSKIIEPTTADSGALSVIFAKGFPSHSSPFLKITIGKSRLNPRFNNIFSRFGLDISADLILMGVFYMSFLMISRQ